MVTAADRDHPHHGLARAWLAGNRALQASMEALAALMYADVDGHRAALAQTRPFIRTASNAIDAGRAANAAARRALDDVGAPALAEHELLAAVRAAHGAYDRAFAVEDEILTVLRTMLDEVDRTWREGPAERGTVLVVFQTMSAAFEALGPLTQQRAEISSVAPQMMAALRSVL